MSKEPNAVAVLSVDLARWPKLVEELQTAIGSHPGLGFAHDGLPGEVRVLGDEPLSPEQLAAAKAAVRSHNPTTSPSEGLEQEESRVARRHGLSLTALRAIIGDEQAIQKLSDEVDAEKSKL